ncbi:hypothetical protein [Methanobrevibacter sp.]|uniref:hypothetical protein n=1 Tax=Methanobrevibacter sp. TaxID=66852 RepID=UPI00388EBC48
MLSYETRFTITKTLYVSSTQDYVLALANFYSITPLVPVLRILNWDIPHANNIAKNNSITYLMDVEFTKRMTICCDAAWNLESSIYNVLYINGAGSTIEASFKSRDEDKWIVLSNDTALAARNITLKGFNTAIENMGGECMLLFVNFDKNKMDYLVERDWGAAILNTGLLTCINCSFTNNFAKNGGAIFNQGMLTNSKLYLFRQ